MKAENEINSLQKLIKAENEINSLHSFLYSVKIVEN